MGPRQTPTRDDYYMGLAFWVSRKSKDPKTQIGSIIVSPNNTPISSGYNGPPAEIDDNLIDWDRPNKYSYILHSEINAIWYGRYKCMNNAIIYVTGKPCRNCILHIVRAGIKKVIYKNPLTDPNSLLANEEEWTITQNIANLGKVQLVEYQGNLDWIKNDISLLESFK